MGKEKKASNPVWEKKKAAIMLNYRRMLKNESKGPNARRMHRGKNEQISQQDKKTFFQRAMEEYNKKKAEKDKILELKKAERKEKEAALQRYHENKKEKFKKLSRKTKWGQPVMSGRMEILLEKIEKSYASNASK